MKLKLFVVAVLVAAFGLLDVSVGPRGALAQFPRLPQMFVTITVLPPQPVEGQNISIRLAMSGTWPNSCTPKPPENASVAGNTITLQIQMGGGPICAQVVTDFSWVTEVPVGKLPTGNYSVRVLYTVQLLGTAFFRVQPAPVQEAALIHGEQKLFPEVITVRRGEKVRLFHTALEGKHEPVVISRDPDGKEPVFGIEPFRVEAGQITITEFTPNQAGEFFITHRRHEHDLFSRLIVKEP